MDLADLVVNISFFHHLGKRTTESVEGCPGPVRLWKYIVQFLYQFCVVSHDGEEDLLIPMVQGCRTDFFEIPADCFQNRLHVPNRLLQLAQVTGSFSPSRDQAMDLYAELEQCDGICEDAERVHLF